MRTATSEAQRYEAIYSPDWLTPEEAGKIAGDVSADIILAAIDAGELQAMKVSRPKAKRRRMKVRRNWLESWMESRTVNDGA